MSSTACGAFVTVTALCPHRTLSVISVQPTFCRLLTRDIAPMYHNFRSNLQRASGDTASSSGQDCTVGGHCELQPPQRFSLQDVQASAGLPLPSRPAPQAPSQHPSSSRLQAAHGKSTGHASAQPMPEQASSISHALASQLLSQTYQAQYEHGPGDRLL